MDKGLMVILAGFLILSALRAVQGIADQSPPAQLTQSGEITAYQPVAAALQ